MSGSLTEYGEQILLKDAFFTADAYTAPTNYYIAACTGVTEAGVISGEPVADGNYARQAVACTSGGGWDYTQVGGVSKMATHANIEWPAAGASWGTITHVAICTSATPGVGDVVGYCQLDAGKAIGIGDILRITAGNLYVTMD